MTGRLRETITTEQAILDKLPSTSTAHDELADHIDRRIRLLVAEQTPYTTNERNERRWGTAFMCAGILGPAVVVDPGSGVTPPHWVLLLAGLLGTSAIVYGLHLHTKVTGQRNERREHARARAELGPTLTEEAP